MCVLLRLIDKIGAVLLAHFKNSSNTKKKEGPRVLSAKTQNIIIWENHLLVVFPPISMMQVQSLVISLLLKGRTLTATFTDDILLGSAITGSGSFNRWTAHWPLLRQSFQRKSL